MNPAAPPGPQAIMQLFQGAQATALLAAGIDLGVFGAIAKGTNTRDAIAAAIKTPPRSTGMLLDALSVIGLLAKKGGQYENSPPAAAHLVPGQPMYMGDMAGIFANPMMWGGYIRLADAVRNDGTVMAEHAETPKHPFWESFAKSSASMAVPTAQMLAGLLGEWIASRPRVRALDVACGSGLYGLTLARNPKVDVTLLDWPNVLAETKRWAERTGADASRVHYLEGNLFEVDYQGPYDLVILSQVFHHFDEATCLRLVKKVAASVAPGGRVAINDFLYDESLANPMAAMFRITMLMWTRQGTVYQESDYRRWLKECGLEVTVVRPNLGMPSTIVVAEKRS